MTTAHELARREMASKSGREFYGTYAKCFADQLKAVYATMKYEIACDEKYGHGMRPGFQIAEPRRLWA